MNNNVVILDLDDYWSAMWFCEVCAAVLCIWTKYAKGEIVISNCYFGE